MSRMELFIGTVEKYDGPHIEVEDTDEFYDLEDEHGCHYVNVDGVLWRLVATQNVDEYGFSTVLEPSDKATLIAYWYNGGGGIHEVAENTIRSWLNTTEV